MHGKTQTGIVYVSARALLIIVRSNHALRVITV